LNRFNKPRYTKIIKKPVATFPKIGLSNGTTLGQIYSGRTVPLGHLNTVEVIINTAHQSGLYFLSARLCEQEAGQAAGQLLLSQDEPPPQSRQTRRGIAQSRPVVQPRLYLRFLTCTLS
jgi:hypothetical protein